MQVTPIKCLSDNYAYIINDNNFKNVGVVDPSDFVLVVSVKVDPDRGKPIINIGYKFLFSF